MTLHVAVLGLGEAGGRIASDLAAAGGCVVRGWDPLPTAVTSNVKRSTGPGEAVAGADLVLSLTTGAQAVAAAASVAPSLSAELVYADLNTMLPATKREVAAIVGQSGVAFADVALLRPVPTGGLRTPALVSGAGAASFVELVRPLGMPVEVVGSEPGDAAGLKLLRSVFMKGLAASVYESMEAATARGADEWLRGEIVDILGTPLMNRLLSGTATHAERRAREMDDAAAYLRDLGVEPHIAAAAGRLFAAIASERSGLTSPFTTGGEIR